MTVYVIITAAGSGSRFGGPLPKQFCLFDGRPLLCRTVEAVRRALPGCEILLTLGAGDFDLWHKLCLEHEFVSPEAVAGGATRFHSVQAGLRALESRLHDDDLVLVHDGARPVVDADMCSRLVEAAREHGAAIPVVPVTDSLRMLDAEGNSRAVDRALFRAVQTPQAFAARLLLDAYACEYTPAFTDDASVVEAAGARVTLVDGHPANIKITNPNDRPCKL